MLSFFLSRFLFGPGALRDFRRSVSLAFRAWVAWAAFLGGVALHAGMAPEQYRAALSASGDFFLMLYLSALLLWFIFRPAAREG